MTEKKSQTADKGSQRRENKLSLIDTHTHLTFPEFDKDRKEVLSRAWDAGLEYLIAIGAGDGIKGNDEAVKLACSDDRIYAAVGVHPHDAGQVGKDWPARILEMSRHRKVVAIGEIGLDYYRRHSEPEIQKKCFRQLLELAKEAKKPVIIHDRQAHDDVWRIIGEVGVPERGCVFHCFSGDVGLAKKVVKAGYYISVPGVITFRNAHKLHEVVTWIPLDRILLETDCPYLAPEPYRGKRNEPAYVVEVAKQVAKIKGLAVEEVAGVTTLSAKRFFSF